MNYEVQALQLSLNATLPSRARPSDAGIDLYTPKSFWLFPLCPRKIPLRVAFALPSGHVGFIKDRSSMGGKGVHTLGGVMDEEFRGDLTVVLVNLTLRPKRFKIGERIAQLVILPCCYAPVREVHTLSNTSRGAAGFGSTGR